MSAKSDFSYTEEELKLTSFYSKHKTAMDILQPTQSMEGRKPTGEAKETPHLSISSEGDLKGTSRVRRFLESKRCAKKNICCCFPLYHIHDSHVHEIPCAVFYKGRHALRNMSQLQNGGVPR